MGALAHPFQAAKANAQTLGDPGVGEIHRFGPNAGSEDRPPPFRFEDPIGKSFRNGFQLPLLDFPALRGKHLPEPIHEDPREDGELPASEESGRKP
jgi:hypothetical protein